MNHPTQPQERLLLLACSGLKLDTTEEVAPLELYTGVMYQVLRKWMPGLDRAQIAILSAKHGLVGGEWPRIAPYDERMNAYKAAQLITRGIFKPMHEPKRGHAGGLEPFPYLRPEAGFRFREIFVAAGGHYRDVYRVWIEQMRVAGWLHDDCQVIEVTGGIGEQRSQLGAWCRSIATQVKEAA